LNAYLFPIVTLIFGFCLFQSKTYAQDTSKKIEERIKEEESINKIPFSITPHKPMYILPLSYNFSHMNSAIEENVKVDDLETKFQFSFKVSIIELFFNKKASLQFGYTQTAFWQVYNKQFSAPFRETNYEPEIFLVYNPVELKAKNWNSSYIFGFAHQSNGRSSTVSRSWNRFYIQKLWNLDCFAISTKAWYRLPEEEKKDPESSLGDDNPDINHYMGYGELMALTQIKNNTISLSLRNNLKINNRGALQFSWSKPINEKYKIYFQYFNGYGESLIDYNINSNRISLGIIINDWI
jgi:phospholipase A1/A2